jgi:hypothetical protein
MSEQFATGMYELDDKTYHDSDAVSRTDLTIINRSAAHYFEQRLNPMREEKEDTPALAKGKSLHTAILEPHLFMENHAVIPLDAPRKPTKPQRDSPNPSAKAIESIGYWDSWMMANAEKTVVTTDQCVELLKIGRSIRDHRVLGLYLADGHAERSIFARDPVTGVLCKCRPDWMTNLGGLNIVVDVKSAEDARPDAFHKSAYKYGYFEQAAYYSDVIEWAGLESFPKADLWLFAVFEKETPYAVQMYEVAPDDIARGRARYRKALNYYAECRRDNHWPAYSEEIKVLVHPAWAKD